MKQESIAITGVMLRREGGENDLYAKAIVEIEVNGQWVQVCAEYLAANFSTIVGPTGMRKCLEAKEGQA